ncbi:hypothetical protein RFI_21457 [Reticulomyxa filosa]|uniref:Uncharacterized protein n=1 Tax=Reticulomyxa filosa TaxID=46433 RepID=X6MQ06_RETFI|nr:hypothetical protein RFI_21457 [Reticulomyxa filosa]|eukprot:ETO15904.1 hypothetical protein RFI_21457 [Reticulomyxa filosa]
MQSPMLPPAVFAHSFSSMPNPSQLLLTNSADNDTTNQTLLGIPSYNSNSGNGNGNNNITNVPYIDLTRLSSNQSGYSSSAFDTHALSLVSSDPTPRDNRGAKMCNNLESKHKKKRKFHAEIKPPPKKEKEVDRAKKKENDKEQEKEKVTKETTDETKTNHWKTDKLSIHNCDCDVDPSLFIPEKGALMHWDKTEYDNVISYFEGVKDKAVSQIDTVIRVLKCLKGRQFAENDIA